MAKRILHGRVDADDLAKTLFNQRAGAFLADNERWEHVKIRLGKSIFKLKRSHANGHFQGHLELTAEEATRLLPGDAAGWLTFAAVTRSDDRRVFDGRVRLLPPEGLSVISDIDDTIKVTEVANRRKMLGNTFVREYVSVPAMAQLYRRWEVQRGAAFHYVSASPWHLYPFLLEFLRGQSFPDGTFHLRDFRLMGADLGRTFRPTRRLKLKYARELLTRFPRRKFILVGDSGESDAATYARLFREYPNQVERICIRNVTGEESNATRWKKVFRSVPANRWQVFDRAENL
jgi:phosphatidate phosphatase APP1